MVFGWLFVCVCFWMKIGEFYWVENKNKWLVKINGKMFVFNIEFKFWIIYKIIVIIMSGVLFVDRMKNVRNIKNKICVWRL